jgi:DNA end-binding protein Ku
MQSVRAGYVLNFGVVTIPVDLFSVIPSSKKGGTRLLCKEHTTPIKQVFQCPIDEELKPEIVKGFEVTKGNFAILPEEDTDSEEIPADTGINLVAVPTRDLNQATVPGSALYYLQPNEVAVKAWEILFRVVKSSKLTLIGQSALRKNSRKIFRLVLFNDYLAMQEIAFPEHVRSAPEVFHPKVEKALMDMAKTVLDAMTIGWDEFDAEDAGFAAFRERITGLTPVASQEKTPRGDNVVDLMDALKASVEATKQKARKRKGA